MKPVWLVLSLLVLTAIVYWPGLSGSLLFDDLANLAPIQAWQEGQLAWRDVVFGNQSGMLGRPISMATFLLSASVGSDFAWQIKFHNLLLHLVCGLLILALLKRLARKSSLGKRAIRYLPMIVVAIWLVHPMFVSTVLYGVQRMAILSTIFMLAGMLAYVEGRMVLERGGRLLGVLYIWGLVPMLAVLGALSKENALLLPLLCAVIEWAYFRPQQGGRRPNSVRAFSLLLVAVPIIIGLVLLLIDPERFLIGYQNRHFTLIERLMTQSRVLFDYAGSLLLPRGPTFSLYRDDYSISTGLLSPPSTLASLLGWAIIVLAAFRSRRKVPGFAAGIGIFLVGHSLESSIFPLLVYFEHRNYFPAIGLFWAMASMIVYLAPRVSDHITNPLRLASFASVSLILILAFSTLGRSLIWQSQETLVEQSIRHHPDSRFARMDIANIEMNKVPPDADAAIEHYNHLTELDRPSTRFIGELGKLAVQCFTQRSVDPLEVSQVFSRQLESIEADTMKALLSVSDIIAARSCTGLSPERLADGISELLDRNDIPSALNPIWRLRFRAARLYLAAGQQQSALDQAELAWKSGAAEIPVAMLIVRLLIEFNRNEEAAELLEAIAPEISPTDRQGQALLSRYRRDLG